MYNRVSGGDYNTTHLFDFGDIMTPALKAEIARLKELGAKRLAIGEVGTNIHTPYVDYNRCLARMEFTPPFPALPNSGFEPEDTNALVAYYNAAPAMMQVINALVAEIERRDKALERARQFIAVMRAETTIIKEGLLCYIKATPNAEAAHQTFKDIAEILEGK